MASPRTAMTASDSTPSLPIEVEREFLSVLDLPRGQREAALDALCGKWPAHAAGLRAWAADASAGRTRGLAPVSLPTSIGPYRILEAIAEGGMGIVYAAEQTSPVFRRVAVKVIRPGMDSREVLARFEQERQALAMMNHPHIAKVLEAGTTPEGRPFFAMEFVAGLPITTFVDKNRLTMRERLELFAQVCDGVQHAHQKGIIHRDLKPSNILVTSQDGKPQSKIIDFGVAKATQQPLTEKTIYTHQGQLVGTPEYMSPEQAEMTGSAVDTRSDIYSLGVLLYELLTGALPFDREAFRKAGLQGMLKILREQEPEKPSTKVTTIGPAGAEMANRRRTEIGTLKRLLRGELDWITIKALEKDPSRRYQSAGEFGADVLRHLRDEPVLAGPPTFVYRFSKLVRRHKGPLAATAAVLAALVGGLAVSLWLLVETDRAWGRERLAREAANAARSEAEHERATVARLLSESQLLREDAQIDRLVAGFDELWPARPERLEAMRNWVAEARQVTATREETLTKGPPIAASESVAERSAIFTQYDLIRRMGARIVLAETVEVETITEPAAAWRAAQEHVARDPRYAGVRLAPRLGLIPLGPDPASGLLEFSHYGSGTPATRGADGQLERPTACALVFVLIPPGRGVWIGAQPTHADRPNYDGDAQGSEPPPQQVDVAAFYLSKYELTQAQWSTLTEGDAPSQYVGEGHPVEFVDPAMFARVLGWHELQFPTEVEWEYGCRAGTTTPWYTGATRETLMGTPVAANLADVTLLERGAPRDKFEIWEDYRDGMAVHGPTGILRPNAFGLHDMLGNVFELCIPGAGPASPDQPTVVRGGAWNKGASSARATARIVIPAAGTKFDNLGVRPVLRLGD